jgi:hypothetical protein
MEYFALRLTDRQPSLWAVSAEAQNMEYSFGITSCENRIGIEPSPGLFVDVL